MSRNNLLIEIRSIKLEQKLTIFAQVLRCSFSASTCDFDRSQCHTKIFQGTHSWLTMNHKLRTKVGNIWKCIVLSALGSLTDFAVTHSQTRNEIHTLKVALQISGRKFYKNTQKSSLYSQSLLIFIHKTPVVESHPTIREIRNLIRPRSTLTGNTVYFYMSRSHLHAENTQTKLQT